MAFAKFQDNRFGIDGEIAENHAILVNLTASIGTRILFSVFIPGVPEWWSHCILNTLCNYHTDCQPYFYVNAE